jgi:acetyl esterase/lipase
MTSKLELDPRLDPRIKAAFAGVATGAPQPNVSSREELLAQELSPEGMAIYAHQVAIFDSMDREDIAPSAGLTVRTETFTSAPDGNAVKIQYMRPEGDATLPCIYYIHGGRMRSTLLRPRTRASSSRCTTTAVPWPTASTPSTPAIRLPDPPSLSARMSRGCRRW